MASVIKNRENREAKVKELIVELASKIEENEVKKIKENKNNKKR